MLTCDTSWPASRFFFKLAKLYQDTHHKKDKMRFLADQTYRNVQLNVVNMKNLAWYYYREGSGDTPQ